MMIQPPALDDRLTKNTIEMVKFAPLLMLFNSYWMLSNQQIFKNKVTPIMNSSQHMVSNHEVELRVDWDTPVLLMSFAAIFLLKVQNLLGDRLIRLGFTMQAKVLEVDEDLPNFFKTVKLSQAYEIVAEEKNMRYNYGFGLND